MGTHAPKAVKLNIAFDPERLQRDLDTAITRFKSAPQVVVIDCFVDDALLQLFPASAVAAINATTHVQLNALPDENTPLMPAWDAHFKVSTGFLPLYGQLATDRGMLKLHVSGIPLPFGFTPLGDNRFRLRNKTLTFTADHRSAFLVDDEQKLNVNLQIYSQLGPLQALYARLQTSVLKGGTTLTLWVSRGIRVWKRATNTV